MAAFALTPWLVTAGIGLLYYRRIRAQFGRQPYRPRRTMLRITVLGLVACGIVFAVFSIPHVATAVAGGAVAGAALGWLAQRHMHLEWRDGRRTYTPHPWIGAALSVALLGRLVWRWHEGGFDMGATSGAHQASPLTFAVLAALVAYYLVSTLGLVRRMRALAPATTAPTVVDDSSDRP